MKFVQLNFRNRREFNRNASKIVYEWNGHLEIFSRSQVKENSGPFLLLWTGRTDILQKIVDGCPLTNSNLCNPHLPFRPLTSLFFPYQTFKNIQTILFRPFFVNLDNRKGPKYDTECFPYFIMLKRGMRKSEFLVIYRFSPSSWRLKSPCRDFGNSLFFALNIRITMSRSHLL